MQGYAPSQMGHFHWNEDQQTSRMSSMPPVTDQQPLQSQQQHQLMQVQMQNQYQFQQLQPIQHNPIQGYTVNQMSNPQMGDIPPQPKDPAGSVPPLIPPSEMGNTAALGAAMNKMYEHLLTALSRHTLEANTRFKQLSDDVAAIKETGNLMSGRVTQAMEQIDSLKTSKANCSKLNKLETETKSFKDEMVKRASQQDDKITAFEKRIQGISNAIENNRCGMALVRNELINSNEILKFENERLRSSLMLQTERLNVLEIKQNRHHLNFDGVPEDANVDPALQIVTKFNNETDAGLTLDDFVSVWGVGSPAPEAAGEVDGEGSEQGQAGANAKLNRKKPRTISAILASTAARDKIMSNRKMLVKNDDGS